MKNVLNSTKLVLKRSRHYPLHCYAGAWVGGGREPLVESYNVLEIIIWIVVYPNPYSVFRFSVLCCFYDLTSLLFKL